MMGTTDGLEFSLEVKNRIGAWTETRNASLLRQRERCRNSNQKRPLYTTTDTINSRANLIVYTSCVALPVSISIEGHLRPENCRSP